MRGNCPRCETVLELPTSGSYACEQCGGRFDAWLAQPHPDASPTPVMAHAPTAPRPTADPFAPRGPVVQGPCAAHPQNAATTFCERCGDFVCALCLTPAEGRRYCPRCFDLLFERGAMGFTQRQFQKPKLAFWLGVASAPATCFYCAGTPMAVVGLYLGIMAIKEINERPELPDRSVALAAIAVNGGVLVVTLLGVAGFIVWMWAMSTQQ